MVSVSLDSSQRRVSFDSFDSLGSLDLLDLDSLVVAARYLSRTVDLSARGMSEKRHWRRLSRWGYWARRSHQSSTVGFPRRNRMADIDVVVRGHRKVDGCSRS